MDVLIEVVHTDTVSSSQSCTSTIRHYLKSQDNIFWLWKSKQMENVYNTQAACTKTNHVNNEQLTITKTINNTETIIKSH